MLNLMSILIESEGSDLLLKPQHFLT